MPRIARSIATRAPSSRSTATWPSAWPRKHRSPSGSRSFPNLSPAHPITTLLDAALRLGERDDLVFLFVGGGLGRREIERFIATHRLSTVRLLPYQPLAELRNSLSAADVHLVTMGEEMVGIVHPCKIYGAMAVGRPIFLVGPRRCHVADILEHDDLGWRADHGDVEGVVARVLEILGSAPAELETRGRRAQSAVTREFGRSWLCGRFCDVIEGPAEAVRRA
jgi:hypothetical protein